MSDSIRNLVRRLSGVLIVDAAIVSATPRGLRDIVKPDTVLSLVGLSDIDDRVYSNREDIISDDDFDELVQGGVLIGTGDIEGQRDSVFDAVLDVVTNATRSLAGSQNPIPLFVFAQPTFPRHADGTPDVETAQALVRANCMRGEVYLCITVVGLPPNQDDALVEAIKPLRQWSTERIGWGRHEGLDPYAKTIHNIRRVFENVSVTSFHPYFPEEEGAENGS